MSRGPMEVGTERAQPNGYIRVKVDDDRRWEFKHRLIAEEKLGRRLTSMEQAYFIDSDISNFDPDNIGVRQKNVVKRAKSVAAIESRLEKVEAEVQALRNSLSELE